MEKGTKVWVNSCGSHFHGEIIGTRKEMRLVRYNNNGQLYKNWFHVSFLAKM